MRKMFKMYYAMDEDNIVCELIQACNAVGAMTHALQKLEAELGDDYFHLIALSVVRVKEDDSDEV